MCAKPGRSGGGKCCCSIGTIPGSLLRSLSVPIVCLWPWQVVKPDLVLMNNVIDAFVRCSEARRARQVLDDMMTCEDGSLPKPDRYSFNTVLKGLATLGEMNGVMDLYRGMQRYGVSPDAITLNTMVDAAVSLGKLDKAQTLLTGGGAAASVEGYSALLEGFVKKGDLQKVRQTG